MDLRGPVALQGVSRKIADVWEKDVWEFQAKSGSSGSCRLFLRFLGKIAVRKMSGRTPGTPRHPSSRHPRSSECSCYACAVVALHFDTEMPWGLPRISKISRTWTLLRRPLFQRTPGPILTDTVETLDSGKLENSVAPPHNQLPIIFKMPEKYRQTSAKSSKTVVSSLFPCFREVWGVFL